MSPAPLPYLQHIQHPLHWSYYASVYECVEVSLNARVRWYIIDGSSYEARRSTYLH